MVLNAVALRIGGEFQEFGNESIDRVRRNKKEHFIGADIIVPEAVWRDMTINGLRDYLAQQVRTALLLCVSRLEKDNEEINKVGFFNEVDAALEEFRTIDYA